MNNLVVVMDIFLGFGELHSDRADGEIMRKISDAKIDNERMQNFVGSCKSIRSSLEEC